MRALNSALRCRRFRLLILVLFQGDRPQKPAQFINKPLAPFPGTTSEIKVARRTVELKINGQVTARYTEKEDVKVPRSGLIALQLQAGPGMEIAFKDIEIRELKP